MSVLSGVELQLHSFLQDKVLRRPYLRPSVMMEKTLADDDDFVNPNKNLPRSVRHQATRTHKKNDPFALLLSVYDVDGGTWRDCC